MMPKQSQKRKQRQHGLQCVSSSYFLLTIMIIMAFEIASSEKGKIEAFVVPKAATTMKVTTALFAKKKATKKKKSSSGAGSSLKGFGGGTATSSDESATGAAKIDKSAKALSFYNYIETNEQGGNNLKRVALATFPPANIRGLVALRDIKKGDAILDIPYELALDLGVENSDPTLPAVTLLQKYCTYLNSDGSTIDGPYMELLPEYKGRDSLTSTDFFSAEALEKLQHPLIVEETLNRREKTKQRYESDVMPNIQNFQWKDGSNSAAATLDHLQWAVWLITSRVLTVQTTDTKPANRLMIPLLDMCNHDRHSQHVLTGRAIPGARLKVLAGCNVKAGEQILISYGGGLEGNDRFIQDYGFLDVYGKDEGKVAFEFVGASLVGSSTGGFGKRPSAASAVGGRRMSKVDRERTLEALGRTSLEEDEEELKQLSEKEGESDNCDLMQVKEALEFRIGVKKALSILKQTT
uniref:SET domain-containing protein n=1 Tax=Ditylum brightwellii TaxID=49249 RepID=A0A6U3YH37_9STRA|mmetsp:Transcript_3478/g.5368  ORF Transcript_3478/g.5368 Transcript_3478/m.5368 type:complete len:466 (+) Transcript_3478:131-1528(+)